MYPDQQRAFDRAQAQYDAQEAPGSDDCLPCQDAECDECGSCDLDDVAHDCAYVDAVDLEDERADRARDEAIDRHLEDQGL